MSARSSHPLLSEPEEAALIKDIAESLNEATDISEAMSAILPRLSHVLGLKTAWAFRFDPNRATFVEVGASGLPPALAANNAEALKSSWCECQDRLVTGHLDTAVNIVRCSRLRDAQGDKEGLTFHASIPMKMNGRALGILNVAAGGARVFTRPALDLLRAIGFHVAVTMDRAALLADMRRRNQQLESLASIAREMTGISERTRLLAKAVQLLAERLGYEAVAILQGDTIVSMVAMEGRREQEYSYQDHEAALLPENQRHILSDACSGMSVPIPRFPFVIRVEARTMGAFGPIDEDILTAFAWYLTALLEHLALDQHALDAARWAERRQLAADLHDSVSQHLFSAQLLARSLRQHQPTKQVEVAQRLEAVLRESQQEMRRLIQALRPEGTPLALELRHRLMRLKPVLGEQLSWDIEDVTDELPGEVNNAVLRIVDEALQNALKHAPGAPVHVLLRQSRRALVLQISDRGPGFIPKSTRRGYGLSTMRERAQALGLRFRLTSQPGHGTRISVTVPKEVRHP